MSGFEWMALGGVFGFALGDGRSLDTFSPLYGML